MTLVFETNLRIVSQGLGLDAEHVPNGTHRMIYEDLLIHIVDRGGERYFQVQQRVPADVDPEGPRFRMVLTAGQEFGIGSDKVKVGRVEGAY